MKRGSITLFVAILVILSPILGYSQTLGWPTPTSGTNITYVGGTSQRDGVSSTIFNGQVWLAFTSSVNCNGTDCQVFLADGGTADGAVTGEGFSGPIGVPSSSFSEGYAVSNVNPAIATVSVNGVPTVFLAFRDSFGIEYLMTSTNLSTWTAYSVTGAQGAAYSPAIAVNPSDSSTIYLGYMNGTSYNPILCAVNTANPGSQSCQNLTGLRTMNFNPGMAFFQGLLYIGFEDRGDSHCLYFYKYSPSANTFTFWNPGSCNEQTSTAPSLATHNGYLYIAFGTNDSSRKFTVRVSTTGNDFTDRQQPGFSMDGPPALLDLNAVGVNYLWNGFSRSNVLNVTNGH